MKLSNLLKFGSGFMVGAIVGGAFIFSSIVEVRYLLDEVEFALPESQDMTKNKKTATTGQVSTPSNKATQKKTGSK